MCFDTQRTAPTKWQLRGPATGKAPSRNLSYISILLWYKYQSTGTMLLKSSLIYCKICSTSKNKNIVKKINKIWKNYSHSSRLFPYSGSFLQISQGLISVQKPTTNIQLFLILPKPEREIWDCASCKEYFLTLCRKRWTKRCHSWHKRWGEWWQVFQALNCKMHRRGDLNGLATVCSSSHPHVGEQHLRI